jgi:hypothetical protein
MNSDANKSEIEAYEKDITDSLTLNDALILIAVAAAKGKSGTDEIHTEDMDLIMLLAQKHPIFKGCENSIQPSINTMSNLLNSEEAPTRLLQTAVKMLTPELKEAACDWVSIVIKSDGELTRKKRELLDKYSVLLG